MSPGESVGGAPALFPEACGWRLTPVVGGGEDMRPQAQQVGCLDSHGVYLLPDAAFATPRPLERQTGPSGQSGPAQFAHFDPQEGVRQFPSPTLSSYYKETKSVRGVTHLR